MKFLLTGEEFGAAEAYRIGLVQEVVAPGIELARATEIAQVIAAQAPLGVQGTLANARIGRREGPEAAAQNLTEILPEVQASADAVEGVMSFLERRDAKFTGR